MTNLNESGRDIVALIEQLTDEEKMQALALLSGMQIGKELATTKETA